MNRYHDLPALYTILDYAAHDAKSYLEIGVRDGASLACVLAAAPPSIERITLCDTWQGAYGGTNRASHQHIEVLLAALGRRSRQVIYLDGDSAKLIPTLDPKKPFDLITIDGDHSEQGVKADLKNSLPLLAEAGTLVVDDITNPEHPHIGPIVLKFAQLHNLYIVEWNETGVGAASLIR